MAYPGCCMPSCGESWLNSLPSNCNTPQCFCPVCAVNKGVLCSLLNSCWAEAERNDAILYVNVTCSAFTIAPLQIPSDADCGYTTGTNGTSGTNTQLPTTLGTVTTSISSSSATASNGVGSAGLNGGAVASSVRHGLTKGQKVGIGVGVGLGIPLLILIALCFFCLCWRRRRHEDESDSSAAGAAGFGEKYGQEDSSQHGSGNEKLGFYGAAGSESNESDLAAYGAGAAAATAYGAQRAGKKAGYSEHAVAGGEADEETEGDRHTETLLSNRRKRPGKISNSTNVVDEFEDGEDQNGGQGSSKSRRGQTSQNQQGIADAGYEADGITGAGFIGRKRNGQSSQRNGNMLGDDEDIAGGSAIAGSRGPKRTASKGNKAGANADEGNDQNTDVAGFARTGVHRGKGSRTDDRFADDNGSDEDIDLGGSNVPRRTASRANKNGANTNGSNFYGTDETGAAGTGPRRGKGSHRSRASGDRSKFLEGGVAGALLGGMLHRGGSQRKRDASETSDAEKKNNKSTRSDLQRSTGSRRSQYGSNTANDVDSAGGVERTEGVNGDNSADGSHAGGVIGVGVSNSKRGKGSRRLSGGHENAVESDTVGGGLQWQESSKGKLPDHGEPAIGDELDSQARNGNTNYAAGSNGGNNADRSNSGHGKDSTGREASNGADHGTSGGFGMFLGSIGRGKGSQKKINQNERDQNNDRRTGRNGLFSSIGRRDKGSRATGESDNSRNAYDQNGRQRMNQRDHETDGSYGAEHGADFNGQGRSTGRNGAGYIGGAVISSGGHRNRDGAHQPDYGSEGGSLYGEGKQRNAKSPTDNHGSQQYESIDYNSDPSYREEILRLQSDREQQEDMATRLSEYNRTSSQQGWYHDWVNEHERASSPNTWAEDESTLLRLLREQDCEVHEHDHEPGLCNHSLDAVRRRLQLIRQQRALGIETEGGHDDLHGATRVIHHHASHDQQQDSESQDGHHSSRYVIGGESSGPSRITSYISHGDFSGGSLPASSVTELSNFGGASISDKPMITRTISSGLLQSSDSTTGSISHRDAGKTDEFTGHGSFGGFSGSSENVNLPTSDRIQVLSTGKDHGGETAMNQTGGSSSFHTSHDQDDGHGETIKSTIVERGEDGYPTTTSSVAFDTNNFPSTVSKLEDLISKQQHSSNQHGSSTFYSSSSTSGVQHSDQQHQAEKSEQHVEGGQDTERPS